VAAYADAHLLIRKGLKGERTVSEVVSLEAGAERTQELARMMSGVEVTREALGAAEALVRSAHRASGSTRTRRDPTPEGGSRSRLRRSA
jgi:DNA repair protein RecN (Recombination protein N)